jgi:hypothetical protein
MEEKYFRLIGHGAKWDGLRRAFASGRVPQTLLISGAANVGKWTLTRLWAQLLLCPNSRENLVGGLPTPCLKCRVCHQIEIETFPDFYVMRPVINATTPQRAPEAMDSSRILLRHKDTSVKTADSFVHEAGYKPTIGVRKVMVIYQADRMEETDAQNALLKTFEEPNAGVHIVLVTDKPSDLLPTILSRAWQLRLGQAPSREIESWLHEYFPALPPAVLQSVVHSSGGRPGLAWRQANSLSEGSSETSRSEQVQVLVESIRTSAPWGFLALSERAQKLADLWGEEDAIARISDDDDAEDKKLARALNRAKLARFLDELAQGYRARWIASLASVSGQEKGGESEAWVAGLDRIGKTRHYILRNANAPLALDVLFSELVQAHHSRALKGPREGSARVPQSRPERALGGRF